MANVVMLLGKSGTGKSTSIKNLDPKETMVFNVLKKRLPFKGSSGMYNETNKNMYLLDDYKEIIKYLIGVSEKRQDIKNIILDDLVYVMRKEYFDKATVAGYSKYTELAQHFQQIIKTCEGLRDDINVFIVMHSEDVVSDNTVKEYKVSTVGKLVDSTYNPMEVVPMVLYSDVHYDDKGNATYGFYTHRQVVNGTIIPAKTPDGMFSEDFIANDLQLVIKAMNEYYG